MGKRIAQIACGLLVAFSLGAIAVGFYLTFFFPKTMAQWAGEDRPLSVLEQLMVHLSRFCSSFGLILFPILLMIVAAGILLFFLTTRSSAPEPHATGSPGRSMTSAASDAATDLHPAPR